MRIPNPTLKDIAAEVGVSISTVSRALADHPAIPQKTKQRVLKAAQKLNYRPNAQARALRNSKTNTIGLVIPNLFNPYFAELAAAVQNAAIDAGLYTLLGISNDDPKGLIQAASARRRHHRRAAHWYGKGIDSSGKTERPAGAG